MREAPYRAWAGPPLSILATALVLFGHAHLSSPTDDLTFSHVSKVDSDQVGSVTIDDQCALRGTLRNGTAFSGQLPTALDSSQLEQRLALNAAARSETSSALSSSDSFPYCCPSGSSSGPVVRRSVRSRVG